MLTKKTLLFCNPYYSLLWEVQNETTSVRIQEDDSQTHPLCRRPVLVGGSKAQIEGQVSVHLTWTASIQYATHFK